MKSLDEPEDEVFDPYKGYEEIIKQIGKDNWFSSVSYSLLSRNAYYQGFITDWERNIIPSYGVFDFTKSGCIRWYRDLPGRQKGPYGDMLINRSRMNLIRAHHLLGIGDGLTSIPPA